jgi:hypothetical protein
MPMLPQGNAKTPIHADAPPIAAKNLDFRSTAAVCNFREGAGTRAFHREDSAAIGGASA